MKSCCKEYLQNEEPPKETWWQRLAKRWQVKGWIQVALILLTFALGGSACAFLAGKILPLLGLQGFFRAVVYIVLVSVFWPLCVLLISIPLGQFPFFRRYLRKMGRRMLGKKSSQV